ncbi:MAG: hypothetical protein R3F48_10000 [Candidatus Zixiibacteriota bacterium]
MMRKSLLRVCALASIFLIGLWSPIMSEEECVKNAWEKYGAKAYEKSIEFADKCIDEFGRAALRTQKQLDSLNIPMPPVGKVSAAERDAIFNRGLLNDVATAYYIKGRSAEALYHKGDSTTQHYKALAEDAYAGACELSYGRTWDPKGWFWSPCQAANDRLPIE